MSSRIRTHAKRAIAAVILLDAAVWTADLLVLNRKIANDGDAYGEVQVTYRFANHLKNRQIEFRTEKPQTVECVHSMFPHDGDTTCWYLQRHTEQDVELDGSQWHLFTQ